MKVKEILAEAKKAEPNTWVWIEKPFIFKTIKIERLIEKLEKDDPEKMLLWKSGKKTDIWGLHLHT